MANRTRRNRNSAAAPTPPVDQAAVDALVHPAARSEEVYDHGTGMGASPIPEVMSRADDQLAMERAAARTREIIDEGMAGNMAYDHGNGLGASSIPEVMDRIEQDRARSASRRASRQQAVDDAYQYGQQYLNNPFDGKGRARMGRQFWEAPLGGHLHRGLAGQEVFGHQITDQQARVAEQAAAGVLATGIGVPAFLAAVRGLTTPQDPGSIPLQ